MEVLKPGKIEIPFTCPLCRAQLALHVGDITEHPLSCSGDSAGSYFSFKCGFCGRDIPEEKYPAGWETLVLYKR